MDFKFMETLTDMRKLAFNRMKMFGIDPYAKTSMGDYFMKAEDLFWGIKCGYYKNDGNSALLNASYVYTNISEMDLSFLYEQSR